VILNRRLLKAASSLLKVEGEWGYFVPEWGFECRLNRGGYFDQRYALSLCLIWGRLHVNLPFKTSLPEGCDMPQYGFATHSNSFWIYTGGDYDESIGQVTGGRKWFAWDLPFITWNFVGHWIKDKTGEWRRVEKGERLWEVKDDEALVETYPYRYYTKHSGVQNAMATVTAEKRMWRRKWAYPLTMVKECIDVEFDIEMGDRAGSYKGGVTGCGYDMLPGETMKECLKRMEREREFR